MSLYTLSGDDVKNVQRKIDDVQNRYGELKDKLTDTLEQMEEALPLAQSFSDAHGKFIDWLVKMEPKTRHKDTNESEEQVAVSEKLTIKQTVLHLGKEKTVNSSKLCFLLRW